MECGGSTPLCVRCPNLPLQLEALTAPLTLFYGRREGRYVYDVSTDGQKFLVIRPLEDDSTRPLTVVQNWTELLKK